MGVQVIDKYTRVWEPHDKQVEFIEIPDSIFEAFYGGAAGGGKTELLWMLPVIRGWIDHPNFHGIIFRKSFPQLEESIILKAMRVYKDLLGATYDGQKHVWTFPSGARIRASYLETLEDAKDHDTAEYHYVAFDELTHFIWDVYSYVTSRIRSTDDGLPHIVRSASNPGNVGHVWVRDRFVAPADKGGVVIHDLATKTDRIFIQAKATDNPYLMRTDPGYVNRLRILSPDEQAAKIDGNWWIFSGQVFREFRNTHRPDEPAHAVHVVPDFEPPDWWPRVLAVDWGFAASVWAGWAAVAPDSRVFIYKEYVNQGTQIVDWGADLKRWSQYETINSFQLDPSAWQKRGEDKSIAQQIEEATGFKFEKADNDRIGGKQLLHEYLRWKGRKPRYVPPEGYREDIAQRIYRVQGEKAYKEYCELFQAEKPETNLPKLQICARCTKLIETIPTCIYQDNNKDGKKSEDVKEFDGDDPYDGVRYLLKGVHRWFNQANKADLNYQARAAIVQRLEATGDWNVYYRQMAIHEQETAKSAGVSRSRHRHSSFVRRRA